MAKPDLAAFVNLLTDGAAFVAADGSITAANRAFAACFGTSVDDLVGRPLEAFAAEGTHVGKAIEEAIERRPQRLRLTLKADNRGEGSEIVCGGALFEAPAEGGAPLLFLRVIDTGGEPSARQATDDFLTAVSHELRSPLNAIVTWAHVLRQGGVEPRVTARALEAIERNANLQARLLDDLVAFARLGVEPVPAKGTEQKASAANVEGAKNEPPPVAAADPDRPLADLSGIRVLVVDDDRDTRDSITALLVENRADASNAGSVREALRSLAERPPHVVVTDLLMPDLDGFSLLRMIRTIESLNAIRIPTIALTALSSEESQRRGLESGFDVYLMKPIKPDELLSIVAAAAQSHAPSPS